MFNKITNYMDKKKKKKAELEAEKTEFFERQKNFHTALKSEDHEEIIKYGKNLISACTPIITRSAISGENRPLAELALESKKIARTMMANSYYHLKSFDEAFDQIKPVLDIWPEDDEALLLYNAILAADPSLKIPKCKLCKRTCIPTDLNEYGFCNDCWKKIFPD